MPPSEWYDEESLCLFYQLTSLLYFFPSFQRRIERLCNHHLSELPAFLVEHGGLNSGFMIAHCTAAALTSENKTLCHPASIDTISTSAAKEDHVSMGGWAARKALQVVENVEYVVAIELLCAVQGLEFHRPLKTTAPLEAVVEEFRKLVPRWEKDRYMKPAIDSALQFVRSGLLFDAVRPFIDN
jgi:histidine ammonia-lyase